MQVLNPKCNVCEGLESTTRPRAFVSEAVGSSKQLGRELLSDE
jgi:hypothetical protein